MQEAPTKTKGPTQEEYDSLLAGKLAAGYAVCCYGYCSGVIHFNWGDFVLAPSKSRGMPFQVHFWTKFPIKF